MTRKPNRSRQTLALLDTMLGQPQQWRHGYDLARETGLKSGTLYPILIRLHDQGYLESRWEESEEPGRPPRHAYRLTASGVALAEDAAAESPMVHMGRLSGAGA